MLDAVLFKTIRLDIKVEQLYWCHWCIPLSTEVRISQVSRQLRHWKRQKEVKSLGQEFNLENPEFQIQRGGLLYQLRMLCFEAPGLLSVS